MIHRFVNLGDVAEVNWGNTSITKASYTQAGYPAFSASGCDGFLPNFEHDTPGVVLSAIGAKCGKCFPASGKWTAIKNTITITPRKNGDADFRFLYYFLNREDLWPKRGVGQPFIGLVDARKLVIPYPPLAEQRRIADVLDRVEALRAKRRAALTQLDSLTQSIFLDLFGDPVSNPKKWPQENLQTFFHFRTGKLDSNAAVVSGQYPFFTCSRENFRINTFAFDCEALLLAGNNASADYSVKHYKGKFNAYQRTYVITLRDERNSYEYSRFVLEHRLTELKRISKGTNTKYLTMELLNRIRVPVAPIDLQREFACRVAAVEKLKTAQRTSLVELDALFTLLQYRAFRGEL